MIFHLHSKTHHALTAMWSRPCGADLDLHCCVSCWALVLWLSELSWFYAGCGIPREESEGQVWQGLRLASVPACGSGYSALLGSTPDFPLFSWRSGKEDSKGHSLCQLALFITGPPMFVRWACVWKGEMKIHIYKLQLLNIVFLNMKFTSGSN